MRIRRAQVHPATDLHANAEVLNQQGLAGAGRQPGLPDSVRLESDPITRSDLFVAMMIPAIFFLGFLFGRTRWSSEMNRPDIGRLVR
jgi:hypothetical protein